ncbi:MAG: outer membrane receptor protein involved in Fe transport, partial [Myxococcota bacterium]
SLLVDATEVGALIEVDGVAVGFTPAVLRVPAGDHSVEVRAPGYQSNEIPVTIEADAEVGIEVSLIPLQEVTAASRRAEAISEAPASVSLISAQEIRAFGYQSVWEAVGAVRGAYQTDDLTYQFLGLRGFSIAGDYGNRILLTLDGHSYNDDLIGASYPAEGMMTDLGSVSRIEVVRGPGSALYGSSAFFGVVNVVTGSGEERPQDGYSLAAVRNGHVRARAGGGTGDDDRGAWASASGAYSQGLDYAFPELADEDNPGGLSQDNDDLYAATMMARAWAGDAELQAHYSVRDKQIPTAAFETTLDDDRARSRDERAFIEARYNPTISDRLRLISRAYIDEYTFDGAFPYAPADGGLSEETWRGLWVGAEPRLLWALGERAQLTLGGEARLQLAGSFSGVENSSGTVYLDETLLPRVFSGYTELDVEATSWATLIVGGRLDQYSTFGLAASPRLAAVLQPSPRDVIKLLAGRAFRAPSVYELTYNDNNTTQATASGLDAETIITAEVEYTRKLDEVLSATAGVFYNEFDGLIDTYLNDDGLYEYANTDGAARSAGAELELLRDWRGGWMAATSYSFQRTRYGALLGEDVPTNSPAHRVIVKAASPTGPGGVRLATLTRAESARATAAGSQTDPALLWDLTATGAVRSGAVQWSLGIRNVLDWQHGHPGGYDLIQAEVPQRGRNLFVEVTHAL